MHRELVERAMAGDHDAFSELARVSIGRLYAVARLILRDPHRAEDATQEALVVAWRDLSALRRPGSLRWLAPPAARARLLSRGVARTSSVDGRDRGPRVGGHGARRHERTRRP